MQTKLIDTGNQNSKFQDEIQEYIDSTDDPNNFNAGVMILDTPSEVEVKERTRTASTNNVLG